MAKKDLTHLKFLFLGVGILAISGGIYFLLKKEYIDGATGVIIGAFLIFIYLNETSKK